MKKLASTLLKSVLIIAATTSTVAFGQNKEMPAGLWEIKTKIDLPGMPKEMAAQMGSVITTQCIKPGQAKWTDQRGPGDKAENKCEPIDMKSDGNKHSWKIKCSDGTKGEGNVAFNGKDSYQMNLKMTSPRGSMNMASTGKKLSDTCESKKKTEK
ncbi:MAG: DUF3617 family protein [Gammaproteobacteria bacterium]|nr:DUF3617 family protein [Gammaproteobacteria bacterium]